MIESIEETIAHHHWCADNCEGEVRDEHSQMVAWLEELVRLKSENAELRELVRKQDALTKAVHAYWAGGEGSLDDFNVMMGANAQVLSLMRELGIEVEDE